MIQRQTVEMDVDGLYLGFELNAYRGTWRLAHIGRGHGRPDPVVPVVGSICMVRRMKRRLVTWVFVPRSAR